MVEIKAILKKLIIALVVIFILMVAIGAVYNATNPNSVSNNKEASDYNNNDNSDGYKPTSYLVRYEITGTAESVSITYSNEDGGTSQKSEVYLPNSCILYPMYEGDFLYISAQNNGEYGSVTTEIYVAGELFRTSTSYGAYVIATSSGILGT